MTLMYTPSPICFAGREWTNWQEKVLIENWGIYSGAQIARAIGRSRESVIARANRIGLQPVRENRAAHIVDPAFERIAEIVAQEFHVEIEPMMGRSRKQRYALARQSLWKIAREMLGLSLPQVAARADRDHTSILSGIRTVERWHGCKPAFREKFDRAYARVRML